MRRSAWIFLVLVIALLFFGVVMLYSTSYAVFGQEKLVKQLIWISMGAIGAAVISRMDYHVIGRWSRWLLGLVLLSLVYLGLSNGFSHWFHQALPFAGKISGAFRTLVVGPLRIQPSEFAKIALILFLANYYGRQARYVLEFRRGFLIPLAVAGVVMVLVLVGGSLSVTIITGGVVVAMLLVAGVRLRYLTPILLPVVAAAVLDVVIAFHGTTPGQSLAGTVTADTYIVTVKDNEGRLVKIALKGWTGRLLLAGEKVIGKERTSRFVGWLNPENTQSGDGYQLWHSYLALGSGGYRGLGFTESRMKQRYLPEAHTDFIMSIVGEELGFVTLILVVLAYSALTILAFWIGAQAVDREGSLICAGTAVSLGLHALVNIGVASGLLPTTGVTAPFVSYGGSNILASCLGVGLLFSVSRFSHLRAQQETSETGEEPNRQPVPLERIFT